MTARWRKVHMMKIISEIEDRSYCGLELVDNPTLEWPEVDCLNCLRCKKAKRGVR